MCDSPIEDLLLLQMAVRLPPVYKVEFREQLAAPRGGVLQIVPQAKLGPYSADFLVKLGREAGLVVECDGADYHVDRHRDAGRDAYMARVFGVSILRVPGQAILGSPVGVEMVAGIVAAQMGITRAGRSNWRPKPGLIGVDWSKRIADGMSINAWTKLYAFGPPGGDG